MTISENCIKKDSTLWSGRVAHWRGWIHQWSVFSWGGQSECDRQVLTLPPHVAAISLSWTTKEGQCFRAYAELVRRKHVQRCKNCNRVSVTAVWRQSSLVLATCRSHLAHQTSSRLLSFFGYFWRLITRHAPDMSTNLRQNHLAHQTSSRLLSSFGYFWRLRITRHAPDMSTNLRQSHLAHQTSSQLLSSFGCFWRLRITRHPPDTSTNLSQRTTQHSALPTRTNNKQ
jgi:hypothetical protein